MTDTQACEEMSRNRKINDLKKCKAILKFNEDKTSYNYQIKSVLLRICQEFMQNSIKYSKCKNIKLILNKSDVNLSFILSDDGMGFDINKKSNGIGLSNMKKRTEIIGGTSTLQSSKENGTTLTISIPL